MPSRISIINRGCPLVAYLATGGPAPPTTPTQIESSHPDSSPDEYYPQTALSPSAESQSVTKSVSLLRRTEPRASGPHPSPRSPQKSAASPEPGPAPHKSGSYL